MSQVASLRKSRPLIYSGIEGSKRSGLANFPQLLLLLYAPERFQRGFPIALSTAKQFGLQLLECSHAITI